MRAMLVLCALVAGCSSNSDMMTCSTHGTLNITVSDDEAQAAICDATVTVTPPGGMPMMLVAAKGGACPYTMDVTPGVYQISVSKSGFRSQASSVNVTTVDCVVQSPTLGFPLVRQ